MTEVFRARDPLLQPYKLKHLTLKNRVMSTAHEPNFSEEGMPKDRYRLYHVEKAKGGIAMTMTAGSAIVSPDSPPAFGNLYAYQDEIVEWMRRLADDCHEFGCAVMIQLTHLGRRTNWNKGDWLPVLAPSPVPEPSHRSIPKEMEDWDIARVVSDYAAAAQRMQMAGLDGVEIECHGHLMDQFWSPATNLRNDEYGGSLDNRLRFSMRVLRAIRLAVGDQFIVGCRLVADEAWEKGFSREEGLEICRRIVADGQVDFLNVIRGHIDHDTGVSRIIPGTGMASAPHLDFAGEVRAATKFPVFHAGRIADIATARHAIAEGKLDMVGMTRAHIADPHIVRKVLEGREQEIRPCVGATYCLDRIYEGNPAVCIHNPSTGREASQPHEISRSDGPRQHVVVVGAGPAGLEAARVAALRGHEVTLLEAASDPGGQIRLAIRVGRRRELQGIVDWRVDECERHGVRMQFNRLAEAEEIRALSPDIVVIATGGLPKTDGVESGSELAVSSWDILSGDVVPAESILLFDDNGQHPGLATAEYIATTSHSMLEIITPERFFAPDVGGTNVVPYVQLIHDRGFHVSTMLRVRALDRRGNKIRATLWSPYSERDVGERIVDQVVIENGTLPLVDLYNELKPHSKNAGAVDYGALMENRRQPRDQHRDADFELYRIGDAVSSRNIHAAVYDALRLARTF